MRHGGGGGGAGGLIGLDAPMIRIDGNMIAKGGGGGGGGNDTPGMPGGEAVLANPFGAVPAGAGGGGTGNGGDGSNGTIGGFPMAGAFGGGGGGGAAGYIVLYGTTRIDGMLNPMPQ